MYCDECHNDHQPIHETINAKFRAFIKANRKWINLIKDGEIIHLPDYNRERVKIFPRRKASFFIYNNDMLDEPFNVRYIGVRDFGEGAMIEFMDGHMDKVYSHYDVM